MAQVNLSTTQKQTHRQRTDLWLPGGEGRGTSWGVGVSRCKLFHLEWISDEVLLYTTGNSIQSLSINRECLCMYDRVTLLYSRHWHNSVNQLYFNF